MKKSILVVTSHFIEPVERESTAITKSGEKPMEHYSRATSSLQQQRGRRDAHHAIRQA